MNGLKRLAATFFYCGYVPFAPGTVAAAAAALMALAVMYALRDSFAARGAAIGALIVTALLANIFSARWAREHFGSEDPSQMVVDEALGMFVSVLLVPADYPVLAVVGGFVLFRLFDIAKPFPMKRIEKLPGWLGIALDDVVAGVYANIVLRGGFICYNLLAR